MTNTPTPTPTAGDLVTVPREGYQIGDLVRVIANLEPDTATGHDYPIGTTRRIQRFYEDGSGVFLGEWGCKFTEIELAASPALPAQSGAGMREALEKARVSFVLAIAFLGRDQGTSREADAIEGVIAECVKAEAAICAALSSPAPEGEATAWRWRSRIKGGAWDAWENGRYGQEVPPFMDVEEEPVSAPEGEAAQGVEPVAKALEWVKHPAADMWRAETILGFYEVSAIVGFLWQFKGHAEYGDALEATDTASAFAAAQADFDRRIRSALAPPSVNQEEASR